MPDCTARLTQGPEEPRHRATRIGTRSMGEALTGPYGERDSVPGGYLVRAPVHVFTYLCLRDGVPVTCAAAKVAAYGWPPQHAGGVDAGGIADRDVMFGARRVSRALRPP
ncbi:hypothetical protein ABTX62_15440 [Streptomyces sp. NPDC096046]|uniref:hypothetical protein n=1 Tax=Streptomyces sp. NPDC096046 TaxID=3155542 RepID=UPI00331E1EF8